MAVQCEDGSVSLAGLSAVLRQASVRAGLTRHQVGNYRSIIAVSLKATETTSSDSAARERMAAEILRGHQQPHIDQALLRRFSELVFTLRDHRA